MDQASATEFFSSLKNDEKLQMLVSLSYYVTIAGRDTYDYECGVKDTARLRALNEVQHHTLNVSRALSSGEASCMPDDAVVAIFFAPRDDKHLSRLLQWVFQEAASATRGTAVTLGQTA
jgi:hypothetical protein